MSNPLSTEDLLAIQQLAAQYNWATDDSDADAYAETFIATGRFESARFKFHGHEELKGFVRNERLADRGLQHWTANAVILPDGPDGAVMRSYVMVVTPVPGGEPCIERNGRYVDRLVRTDGGWRFSERSFRPM